MTLACTNHVYAFKFQNFFGIVIFLKRDLDLWRRTLDPHICLRNPTYQTRMQDKSRNSKAPDHTLSLLAVFIYARLHSECQYFQLLFLLSQNIKPKI